MTKRGTVLGVKTLPPQDKNLVGTPPEVADLLVSHLPPGAVVTEPCAGRYQLAARLEHNGLRIGEAFDVVPRDPRVGVGDATQRVPAHLVVTNPPFARDLLVPILRAATGWPKGAWLLLPLDVTANQWFGPFAPSVARILPVGRVRWIAGSKGAGYENYAWVAFGRTPHAFLLPRQESPTKVRKD